MDFCILGPFGGHVFGGMWVQKSEKSKNLKNAQKPPKMVSGINLGQKSVFSGIFAPGAENWPFSRKWAFRGPKRAIFGQISGFFDFFGQILTFFPLTKKVIKTHFGPFLGLFGPFWAIFRLFWAILGSFWAILVIFDLNEYKS